MSDFIDLIVPFFSWIINAVQELVYIICSEPATLIVTFGFLICGSVFGYVQRLVRGR